MHSRPSMYSPVLSSSALPFCAVHSISLVHSKKMNGKISTTRLCKISGFRRHVVHIFNILGCCATLVYQPMLHSKLKQLFIRTDTTHLRTSAPNADSNLKRPSWDVALVLLTANCACGSSLWDWTEIHPEYVSVTDFNVTTIAQI